MNDKSPSPSPAARDSPEKSPTRRKHFQMEEDNAETVAALQAKMAEKDKQLQEQIRLAQLASSLVAMSA